MPNHTKDELSEYNTELRNRRQRIRVLEAELDAAKAAAKRAREDFDDEINGLLLFVDDFNQDLPLIDGVCESDG